jgi:hypothetical protein
MKACSTTNVYFHILSNSVLHKTSCSGSFVFGAKFPIALEAASRASMDLMAKRIIATPAGF